MCTGTRGHNLTFCAQLTFITIFKIFSNKRKQKIVFHRYNPVFPGILWEFSYISISNRETKTDCNMLWKQFCCLVKCAQKISNWQVILHAFDQWCDRCPRKIIYPIKTRVLCNCLRLLDFFFDCSFLKFIDNLDTSMLELGWVFLH